MRKNYNSGSAGYGPQTPFNSSLAYLERLERRWEDADDCKIEGDMIGYFRTLHTVYMNTHPFFDEEECSETQKLINDSEESTAEINNKMSMKDASLFITELEKLPHLFRVERLALQASGNGNGKCNVNLLVTCLIAVAQ